MASTFALLMGNCSKVPGVMHACGHDIHGTINVGAASILSKCKDQFSGSLYFSSGVSWMWLRMAVISGVISSTALRTSIMAFHTPLNGPMMGCLAMVGVSYSKYIKWAIKFLVIQYLVAAAITMGLSAAGWVGF